MSLSALDSLSALSHETPDHPPRQFAPIRQEALDAPESGIVEVFNYGRTRQGLIPLWAGEGDMPTPSFITDEATRSLAAGEHFYTYQRGIPELRQAIAGYMSRLYERPLDVERFNVTIGGMHALQMAVRIAAGVGDEVIIPSPAWPNFVGTVKVAGATPVEVAMTLDPAKAAGGWYLDLEKLAASVTPRTRAIIINSPSNPTGWTATREELSFVLDLSRRHGLWIIADEIYGRFVFDGSVRAPSFHDIMDAEDRVLFVQTFSKNWAMTGWRLGWLECHPSLGQVVENLMQYSCSGVAPFVQRAGVAAIERGEGFVAHQLARVTQNRTIVCDGLGALPGISFAAPAGAFYLFFSVAGETDTRKLALRLVDEANVGLAPGTGFGPGGADYLRLCFARRGDDLVEATRRLAGVLAPA
jgi:aspartate/methionine/tyrosine aminotransferase